MPYGNAIIGKGDGSSTPRLNFVVWCRAVAVLSVLWYHLVQTFCGQNGIAFLPDALVRRYLIDPLHLDIGQFGVTLFFLVSGFIITHVALRETSAEFAIKRLFRIYPPLIVSVFVMTLMIVVLSAAPYPGKGLPVPSLIDIVRSSVLIDRIVVDGPPYVNPVLWTLVLEILFYAIIAMTAASLRRYPRLTVLGFLVVDAILIAGYPISPELGRFSIMVTLLAPLFFGQTLYLAWSGRITFSAASVFLIGWWVLGEWAVQVHSYGYNVDHAVGVWRAFAYLIFILFLMAGQIGVPRPIGFVADTSYSIYLLHLPLGYLPMDFTLQVLGYPTALILALLITCGASWASYRWIETPSQDFARSLIRGWRAYLPGHSISVPNRT